MRKSLFFSTLLLTFAVQAGAQEPWALKVFVPSEVKYEQSTPDKLKPTVEKIQEVLMPGYSGEEHVVDKLLTCGPFLWRDIQDQPAFRGGKGTPTAFIVPTGREKIRYDGRTFQQEELSRAVEDTMRSELKKDGKYLIRKLNSQELSLLWTFYADNLEDPLLLLESQHHKYVLVFVKGQLFMVDDFFDVDKRVAAKPVDGPDPHPFVEETARAFWSKPGKNTDASKLVSGEGIQILSPGSVILESMTADQLIGYTQSVIAVRDGFLAKVKKRGSNLSIQLEMRPGKHFVTIVCEPALDEAQKADLVTALMSVPLPVAQVRSNVALQIFARVWGGR